jgi:hypothetical protein
MMTAMLPAFLDRYDDRVSGPHADLCRQFVARFDEWAQDRRPPFGLVHGDYRLDNIMFGDDRCIVVDWQTFHQGPLMTDAAAFLASGLSPEVRPAHGNALVRGYFDALVRGGVTGLRWEECWEEYWRQSFVGVVAPMVSSMLVERPTEGTRCS